MERVKIPDRYTTTIGVENRWRNDLSRAKGKSDAIKKKTFDISGQICITEKSTGYAKEKNFQANDASGKTWNENVALVGDRCYRQKCGCKCPCKKGGSDSDYYDYSDEEFGPSCAAGTDAAGTDATASVEAAGEGSGTTATPPADAEVPSQTAGTTGATA